MQCLREVSQQDQLSFSCGIVRFCLKINSYIESGSLEKYLNHVASIQLGMKLENYFKVAESIKQ